MRGTPRRELVLLNSGAALVGAFHILGAEPPALPVWVVVWASAD